MISRILVSIFCLVLLSGCATYQSPSSLESPATINFEKDKDHPLLGWDATFLVTINGQKPSFFRFSDKIQLRPGENTLVVGGFGDDLNVVSYVELTFNVIPNETYQVNRTVDVDSMNFQLLDAEGRIIVEQKAFKRPRTTNDEAARHL